MPEVTRRMRNTDYKFNNEKDYLDYSISCFCEESLERIHGALDKFVDEIGKILEEDRKLHKEKEAIPGE